MCRAFADCVNRMKSVWYVRLFHVFQLRFINVVVFIVIFFRISWYLNWNFNFLFRILKS